MDSFLLMVSDTVRTSLTNDELDSAFRLLHNRMVLKAPERYPATYGVVAAWNVELDEHCLTGFLEPEAGPRGEHVVTLLSRDDVGIMQHPLKHRLQDRNLCRVAWMHTVN